MKKHIYLICNESFDSRCDYGCGGSETFKFSNFGDANKFFDELSPRNEFLVELNARGRSRRMDHKCYRVTIERYDMDADGELVDESQEILNEKQYTYIDYRLEANAAGILKSIEQAYEFGDIEEWLHNNVLEVEREGEEFILTLTFGGPTGVLYTVDGNINYTEGSYSQSAYIDDPYILNKLRELCTAYC